MTCDIFQGSLGSGKSASLMVDALEWLTLGGCVAMNFNLVPDWPYRLADRKILVKLGFLNRDEVALDYWKRLLVVSSVESLWKASEILLPRVKGKAKEMYEGNLRLYIDEAQLFFNAREWQKNKDAIHFFSQSRKLKYDVYLAAHNVGMIDKQIRPYLDYETRFRNLQKVRFPFLGFPLSPFPCFLAITRYAGIAAGAGQIAKRRLYPVDKWACGFYDSALIFDPEMNNSEPLPCGPRPGSKVKKKVSRVKVPKELSPDHPMFDFFMEVKKIAKKESPA